jgi:hypothetical protein
MGQRVFQIAKDLHVDSKVIVRKLMHENLPPPAHDQGENGWQRPWTPRSPVSVGLRELIREWHTSGELLHTAVETGEPAEAKTRKKSRVRDINVCTPDLETALSSKVSMETVDNSLVRQALETVAQIEQEARQKKRAQMEGLRDSRTAIVREIRDLNRQISQMDKALQAMADHHAGTLAALYTRTHRDLSELRERMGVWLESRRGEKFGAAALAGEFPELGNTAVSYVLRPLVKAGRIQTDAFEGSKRPKYFARQ